MQRELRNMNDIDFMTYVRLYRREHLNIEQLLYINDRLKRLGYTIEYGCCGTNNIRKKK